jgi:hypothetical protein
MKSTLVLTLFLVLSILVVGCGKKEEPKPTPQVIEQAPPPPPAPAVAGVSFAKGFDVNMNAVNPTTTFKPKDRVVVLVTTENVVPGAMLRVRCMYVPTNQLVRADSIALQQTGTNKSQFFFERAKGLPTGEYKLETSLNGTAGMAGGFTVVQ